MTKALILAGLLLAATPAEAATARESATPSATPTPTRTTSPTRARLIWTPTQTPTKRPTLAPIARATLRPTQTPNATPTALPTPWIYDRSELSTKRTPMVTPKGYWTTPGIRSTLTALPQLEATR